jgi:hypothetical protein
VFLRLKLYTSFYLSDLSSEVTICCQAAVPGTDGNEHCTSVDGCLKQCWSLVEYIKALGKCGRNNNVFITVSCIRLVFHTERFCYCHIYLNTVQHHFRLLDLRFTYVTFIFSDPKTRMSLLNYLHLIFFCVWFSGALLWKEPCVGFQQ